MQQIEEEDEAMQNEQKEINRAGDDVNPLPPMSAAMQARPRDNKILVQQETSRKSLDEADRDVITANVDQRRAKGGSIVVPPEVAARSRAAHRSQVTSSIQSYRSPHS